MAADCRRDATVVVVGTDDAVPDDGDAIIPGSDVVAVVVDDPVAVDAATVAAVAAVAAAAGVVRCIATYFRLT